MKKYLKIKTMKDIKTTDDGWDCIPELQNFTDCYEDNLGHLVYEIKHCKREMSLEDMIYELENFSLELLDTIKEIRNKYDGVEIIEITE